MADPVSASSSSSSSNSASGMTIDLRPMIEDVSQVMTKHITTILTGVIGEYTIYKETHDTIMGLPCVRKLQDRIAELEQDGCGSSAREHTDTTTAASGTTSTSPSREDEIAQLKSAIAEMNRYIIALESKVDMKVVCSSAAEKDEESVRLEIHEEEKDTYLEESADNSFTVSSTHKNVIISASTAEIVVEEEEEEATEEEEEATDEEAAEEEEEATEEEAAEEEAAEEEEEAAEEEEEATEEEAAEEEEDATEEEEAEEEAVEAEEEEEAAEEEAVEEEEATEEEAEIEVSEVKIKGKTYFTTDSQNGIIYACVDDDVGDEVGVFKNGVAVFNKGKK